MYNNNFFTKTVIALSLTLFLQNFAIGQCPPGATSAANATIVNVDSGVNAPVNPVNPLPPAIQIYQICLPIVDAAASTIDVNFQGTTTTFTKNDSSYGRTGDENCRIEYDNVDAEQTITTPFVITFSDNASEDCSYAENGVLPVEISKFDVELIDNVVFLEWETVEELNNDYFEIYRSNDTKNWESVAIISGAGTTLQTIRYTHKDENPEIGKNYYMLAQYDYDGSIQIHELKVITLKGERNNIKLYPNPASQNLTVEVWEDSEFPLDVTIFDTTGKLVAVRQLTDYTQSVDIAELDKGFYYLQVNTEHESISKRFVKQ